MRVYLAKKRKITLDSKKMLSAFLIAIFLLGMANLAAISNASSPPSSSVTISVYVENGGNQVGPSAAPVVYVNSTSGYTVSMFTMGSSNSNMVTIPYGTYMVTALPTNTTLAGKVYFTNKKMEIVNVDKPYLNLSINQSSVSAQYTPVTIQGLNGQTATILFSSMNGNVFNMVTTSSSSFNTYLPSTGEFNAVVYFNGNPDNGVDFYNVMVSSTGLTLDLNANSYNYYGTVYQANGNTVPAVKVLVYNSTYNIYSAMKFNSASFFVSTSSSNYVVLECSGCNPMNITGMTVTHKFTLYNLSSSVVIKYSLGKDLRNLTVNESYIIDNNTPFPGLQSTGSGYLAFQEKSTSFTNDVKMMLANMSTNSYYFFLANNSYYNLTGNVSVKINQKVQGDLFANVTATYYNNKMSSSDYKNLVLKIFQNSYTFLQYKTFVSYSNSTVSVKSASSTVSYSNPFEIYPVSSPQWVTVNFGKSQKPVFMNSNIMVYYPGIKTTSSVLNSSSSNTVIVVPINENVSINVSQTLYNPVNGMYQYLPPVSFIWNVSGKILSGSNVTKEYNISYKFTNTVTNIHLMATDTSNLSNSTNLTVLALPSTDMPYVNLTYNVNGKNHTLRYSPMGKTIMANIVVNQNQAVKFNAQSSSLNYTYNGKKYSLQLSYSWAFPNYTTSGFKASYIYTVPSVKAGIENSYLNITSSVNTTTSVMIMAYVNDTTPTSPVITLQNMNHTNVSSVLAGSPMIVTANYSSDQYYQFSDLKFNWTFRYANGTIMNTSSSNFSVIAYNPSASSWNSSNWLIVQFNILTHVHIGLQVSNPNVTAYSNQSYVPSYTGPKLQVTSIYYTGGFTQGTTKMIEVNVTNDGTATARNVQIIVKVGNSIVGSQTFSNINLTQNQTKSLDVNISFPNAGSQNIVVYANTTSQPYFIAISGEYSTSISVGASPYKVPLVIAAIVVIIIIVGLLYYRVTQGSFPTFGRKKQQTTMPSKPKAGEQKPAEQSKSGNKKQ